MSQQIDEFEEFRKNEIEKLNKKLIFKLPEDYSKINEEIKYIVLNKRTDLPAYVTLPYSSSIKVEWGIDKSNNKLYIRRIFYPKSEFGINSVLEIARDLFECPYCLYGTLVTDYENIEKYIKRNNDNKNKPNGDNMAERVFNSILDNGLAISGISASELGIGTIIGKVLNNVSNLVFKDGHKTLVKLVGSLVGIGGAHLIKNIPALPGNVKNAQNYLGWMGLDLAFSVLDDLTSGDASLGFGVSLVEAFKQSWNRLMSQDIVSMFKGMIKPEILAGNFGIKPISLLPFDALDTVRPPIKDYPAGMWGNNPAEDLTGTKLLRIRNNP